MEVQLGGANIHVTPDTFEPGVFSNHELTWLADHLSEPPVSAFADDLPVGVNRLQVEPMLNRLYELQELERHRKVSWVGAQAILDSIQNYLEWQERTTEIRRRTQGRVSHASQYVWDDEGIPTKFAIGADSAPLIRTRILDDGTRESFGVRLTGDAAAALRDLTDLTPWTKRDPTATTRRTDAVDETKNGANGLFTCGICAHVEQFQVGSQTKRMAAVGRMSRHLKNAKTDVARHRMLYTRKFASRGR